MCWNKSISLNTFLFAMFTIGLLYINKHTKYDPIKPYNDIMYTFFIVVCSIQLVEYFLWSSIENNDRTLNTYFSIIGFILIIIQPFFALQLNPTKYTNYLSLFFIASSILLIIYKTIFNPIVFNTVVKGGHLSWQWIQFDGIEKLYIPIWLFCVCYNLMVEPNKTTFIATILILIFSLYNYYKYNTWTSMWCWVSNAIFIYYLIKILLVLPYNDLKSLC
jgi:hypothetical protein